MGKGASDPPAAPDPKVTSQAQTESNAATARLTAQLNRVNQVGPTGKITYTQGATPLDRTTWENQEVAKARAAWDAAHPAGTTQPAQPDWMYDGGGAGDNFGGGGGGVTGTVATPGFDETAFRQSLAGRDVPTVPGQDQWTMTTELSPEQQRLYDLSTRAQTTYGETANTMLDAVKGQLSQPINIDWNAERDRALKAQMGRLSPTLAAQEEQLRSRLRNSGITEGSEGWNREFNNLQQGRNDMLLAADLNAGNTVGQAIQQVAALRGIPLNEAAALLTGQQVQTPQLANTPSTQVAPTDVLGAYNTQYQGQLARYNAEQQNQAAGLGGMFGLAGTLSGLGMRKWMGMPF